MSPLGLRERKKKTAAKPTSNRPLPDWGKLIGDVPTATAILDRFLQNAELIEITGKSYRLRGQKGETSPPDPKPAKPDHRDRAIE